MKKSVSIFLCIAMLFGISQQAFAENRDEVNSYVQNVADYIYEGVPNPQFGSIGGEWAVLGLARSGADIPAGYLEKYYQTVENRVKSSEGILSEKKYTEYARVIIALTAIGQNPENVGGYNLLTPLGDYEKTVWQGINGSIWALIALDSGHYAMPQNSGAAVAATREMYVNHILENQTANGGWAFSGEDADPDITAMALQALSNYRENDSVKAAAEKALEIMSEKQNPDGGFSSWGTENSESCAQMIVALCELGIPLDDARFVKNNHSMLDNLLSYYINGKGFKHTMGDTESNQMATEQCFYALAAVKRANEGKTSLYDMSDAVGIIGADSADGLANKNPDVKKMPITNEGKTFGDIGGNSCQTEIETLASRGIINGKSETNFEPDSTMTRAEFATIIARGLGLPTKDGAVFSDVSSADWFYDYVNTAYAYGIVKGVSENEFNPNGTITREESAAMITRAAALCGMDTEIDISHARDILAQFSDYVKAADWAICSLSFCYGEGILPSDVMEIKPKESVSRAEIAYMLYNMLKLSALL